MPLGLHGVWTVLSIIVLSSIWSVADCGQVTKISQINLPSIKWVLGYSAESCALTCSRVTSTCNAEAFRQISSREEFIEAAAGALELCSGYVLGDVMKSVCAQGIGASKNVQAPVVFTFHTHMQNADEVERYCSFPEILSDITSICSERNVYPPAQRFCACQKQNNQGPSSTPTAQPSVVPYITSSMHPSAVPAIAPSSVPTPLISVISTLAPSASASAGRSISPSRQPTPAPQVTLAPTILEFYKSPSAVPSVIPSAITSDVPSAVLSSLPTFTPSTVTTNAGPEITVPTTVPSMFPSVTTSGLPTLSPSALMSGMPSMEPPQPYVVPSAVTSEVPTSIRSPSPSAGLWTPSTLPSASPRPVSTTGTQPSTYPSPTPSLRPTETPTAQRILTRAPTDMASASPSAADTSSPSAGSSVPPPSPLPSYVTSTIPPTIILSALPSADPTVAYFTVPTGDPTNAPFYVYPSALPSPLPTSAPAPAPNPTAVPATCPTLNQEGDIAPVDISGGTSAIDAACPVKVVEMRWYYRGAPSSGEGASAVYTSPSLWGVSGGVISTRQPGNVTLLAPGDVVSVDYSVKIPDNVAPLVVTVTDAHLSFVEVQCGEWEHPRAAGFAVAVPDQSFNVSNELWLPAEQRNVQFVGAGRLQVPHLCGQDLPLRVVGQISFSARVKACLRDASGEAVQDAVVKSAPPPVLATGRVRLPSAVPTSPPSNHPLLVPSRAPARAPTIAPTAGAMWRASRAESAFAVPSDVPFALERRSSSTQRAAPSPLPGVSPSAGTRSFSVPSTIAATASVASALSTRRGHPGTSEVVLDPPVVERVVGSREDWLLSRTVGVHEEVDFAHSRAGFLVPSLGLCAVLVLCFAVLWGKSNKGGEGYVHRLKNVKVQRLVNHKHKDELHKR